MGFLDRFFGDKDKIKKAEPNSKIAEPIVTNRLRAEEFCEEGDSLFMGHDYWPSIYKYSQAISLDPKLARAWSSQGLAFHDLGKNEDALESMDKAIEIDPKVDYFLNKSWVLYALGRYEEALKIVNKAFEMGPNELISHYLWYNKIQIFYRLGKHQESLDTCNKIIHDIPDTSATVFLFQGNAFYGLSRYEDALESYERSLNRFPGSILKARIWPNKGIVLKLLHHDVESRDAFDYARRLGYSPKQNEPLEILDLSR